MASYIYDSESDSMKLKQMKMDEGEHEHVMLIKGGPQSMGLGSAPLLPSAHISGKLK